MSHAPLFPQRVNERERTARDREAHKGTAAADLALNGHQLARNQHADPPTDKLADSQPRAGADPGIGQHAMDDGEKERNDEWDSIVLL